MDIEIREENLEEMDLKNMHADLCFKLS